MITLKSVATIITITWVLLEQIHFIHGDCGGWAADGIGGSGHTGIIGIVG